MCIRDRLFVESLYSAINSIRANATRSFLTSLAIIIGTASVIAMIAIGEGAQNALNDEIDELGGRVLSVYASQRKRGGVTYGSNPLIIKDAEALRDDTKVDWKITPSIEGSRQIKFGNNNMSAGISGHWTNYFDIQGYKISSGRNFTENENLSRKRVAVIGPKVATELKTSPRAMLNKELLISGVPFRVIGILESEGSSGWRSPDDNVYVPLLTASDRIYGRKTVNSISVSISNDQNIEEAMVAIEQVLRRQHDIGPGVDNDFRINDWSQYSDLRNEAVAIFTILITGIAGISLLVGGIGVMNIMLVSVTERTREIGLRKALGATHRAIMMQFIVEAMLLCLLGGIIGVILGAGMYYIFSSFQEWAFYIPLGAIIGSITFSAAVGLFFGIWPARRAAKLDPALSLRYE